ncbi:hypothetical protein BI364_07695 [Acidihalobacter yilgarnensis]|uniref:Uncharacterized protein n=1 Tax=Acidihalobacter yilgarnensis TaxID=2819280 RepID=A0A1D8IN66_9GAMM|nr:hypothetical protein [Acidihalobacter yilgarnensis]AOU97861.1 hypothetical protein BI364_07695 [Acidihalobacter yilgarnensis]
MSAPPRPPWLDDEPEVLGFLGTLLDWLDRTDAEVRVRPPSLRLDRKRAPRLYRHDQAADRTWALMRRDLEGRVCDILPKRRRGPYEAEYVGASLRLIEGGEAMLRAWLSRPAQPRYREAWAIAVAAHADAFADRGDALASRPVKVAGKSPAEVVSAFARIGEPLHDGLTLRQLSARCFWGHSKLLDARAGLLKQLFPTHLIAPRPVLAHVHLVGERAGVLFIENQDTYIQALSGQSEALARLDRVYGAGFRGSAERIRTRDGVSLHYHGADDAGRRGRFEDWWFGGQPDGDPLWFWGDLDYAGMAILKALRQRFGDVRAWPAGYDRLLSVLEVGGGHLPEVADKAEQLDPGTTGCVYADETLLPALRRLGRFVDQEIV